MFFVCGTDVNKFLIAALSPCMLAKLYITTLKPSLPIPFLCLPLPLKTKGLNPPASVCTVGSSLHTHSQPCDLSLDGMLTSQLF